MKDLYMKEKDLNQTYLGLTSHEVEVLRLLRLLEPELELLEDPRHQVQLFCSHPSIVTGFCQELLKLQEDQPEYRELFKIILRAGTAELRFKSGARVRVHNLYRRLEKAHNYAGLELSTIGYTEEARWASSDYFMQYLRTRLRSRSTASPKEVIA